MVYSTGIFRSVDSKGFLRIPQIVRTRLGIKPLDTYEVCIDPKDNSIIFRPVNLDK